LSHTWLDRGGAEVDLMELNGWTSPQMLRRYGASTRSAWERRTYDRIMEPMTHHERVPRSGSPGRLCLTAATPADDRESRRTSGPGDRVSDGLCRAFP
jgi:hypothetical protein